MIRFFGTHSGKVFMNIFVSIGAVIVILGALGKILHAPWGTVAITAGMLTECLIFFLMIFVPVEDHLHWDRYYPDIYKDPHDEIHSENGLGYQKVSFLLNGEEEGLDATRSSKSAGGGKQSKNVALDKLDDMLNEAQITPKNLKQLADNFQKLNTTVTNVADIAHTVANVKDFTSQTKEVGEALVGLKNVYINAAKEFTSNNFSSGIKNFYDQMQGLTKNISSLNAIYGVEIKDTMNDIKRVRKYFNNVDVVASQLSESADELTKTKKEISSLTHNLSHLNTIYGKMLTAMQAK